MVEIAKIRKWDILGDFQSTCNTQFSMSLKNDIFAYCVVSIRVIKWYSMPEESFVGRRNSFGEGHKSSRNAFGGKHVKKLILIRPVIKR